MSNEKDGKNCNDRCCHQFFNLDIDKKVLDKLLNKLKEFYDKLPVTICHNCPNKEKNEADCCRIDNPPIYLIEFLNIIYYYFENKTTSELNDLIYRCYEWLFDLSKHIPCIFLNEPNICEIYNKRCFNCRNYSLVPDDEWEERRKLFIETTGEKHDLMDKQCTNVRIESPKFLIRNSVQNKKIQDDVFNNIMKLDAKLGINIKEVYKNKTRMSFPLHLLLFFLGPDKLDYFLTVRELVGNDEEKKKDLLKNIKNMVYNGDAYENTN